MRPSAVRVQEPTSNTPRRASALRGYLSIASAALLWGASASLGKAVFTGRLIANPNLKPLDPLILAQARVTISLLVLAPLLAASRHGDARWIQPRDMARCFLLGTLGIAISNFTYYLAIAKTTVATAIIVQYTAPAWVLLYMISRRLQRATIQRTLAVAAAVLGSALAIGFGGSAHVRVNAVGLIAAILAAFSFAFYNVYGHRILREHDVWTTINYALLGASLFWLIVNPPWKILAAHYSLSQWVFLGAFAMISALVPFSLYFSGLQHLDATRAIVTSCLEPVFAILFAALFVGEEIRGLQLAGIVLVLVASVLVQLPARSNGQQADAQLSMAE